MNNTNIEGPSASIDLGSNTFLITIGQWEGDQLNILFDDCRVTRLGQGVSATQKFHPEALERVEECFAYFQSKIKEYKVIKVRAVATSAARDVKNRDEFLALGEKYGIPIEIIGGDREAELTFLGAMSDQQNIDDKIVIDVGGGSTEIVAKDKSGQIKGYSLDIGSVRLTEMFVKNHPIDQDDWSALQSYIKKVIVEHKDLLPSHVEAAVAVAGTPTTLTCVHQKIPFSVDKVQGFKLEASDIENWCDKLINMNLEQRLALAGMQPGREDVLPAGAATLLEVLRFFKLDSLEVSVKGVRYGLFYETM